jgi:hypothetical protein
MQSEGNKELDGSGKYQAQRKADAQRGWCFWKELWLSSPKESKTAQPLSVRRLVLYKQLERRRERLGQYGRPFVFFCGFDVGSQASVFASVALGRLKPKHFALKNRRDLCYFCLLGSLVVWEIDYSYRRERRERIFCLLNVYKLTIR